MKKLGLIKENSKTIFPLLTTRPRTMTFAEYQLLTPEQRQGEIIISDYPVPVEGDYVEVTADGVKTYATLLSELYALIDTTKISQNSLLVVDFIAYKIVCVLTYTTSAEYQFSKATISSGSKLVTDKFVIKSANSTYGQKEENVAISDRTSQQPTSGIKFTLYYNSTKTLELGTLAQNCMMSDGVTSVEEALNDLSSIGTSYKITTISVTVATKTRERVSQKVTLNRGRYLVVTSQMIQDMSAINSYVDIRDADGTSYILSTGSLNVVGTFDITSDNTEVFASAYNNSSSATITISAGDIRYAYWDIIKIK